MQDICNMGCFNCVHPDCIMDEVPTVDVDEYLCGYDKNTRRKIYDHKYHNEHREELNEKAKKYRLEHPDKVKKYKQKYVKKYKEDPEYRERILEYHRKWRARQKASTTVNKQM